MAASLTFATPIDLCTMRALIDYASLHADEVLVDCPVDDQVNRYLTRMDFYADLSDKVVLSKPAPRVRRNDRRKSLIELLRIGCNTDAESVIVKAWEVTKGQFGPGPIAKACATALGAAIENVNDHSKSPVGAFVAAQRYQQTGLELAVVDLGLGIPTTLRSHPDYQRHTDLDAVRLSLADNVTSTGEDGRGGGLPELVDAVQRAGDSTLTIRSGEAHLTINVRSGKTEEQSQTQAVHVPGTWISLRLQA